MSRLLQSGWIVALVGCLSYLLTTAMLWRLPARPRAAAAPAVVKKPVGPGPSWTFHNPELEGMVQELREERESLRAERAKLEEWAARLQAERQEINAITQAVQSVQREIDQTIKKTVVLLKEQEKDNLKRTAKLYLGMAPESAAKLMREMEDDQLVKLLGTMKESETAPLLELMAQDASQVKRVAAVMDRLRFLVNSTPTNKAKLP
jgi:flagellar motility protein MotE (MotC chaperone)